MDWIIEHWLAGVLLAAYTAVLFYHAHVGRKRSQSLSDFYVGGRNMSGFVVGVSFFATFASTNTYIGNAGKGYEYGVPWLLTALLMLVFTYLSWTFVAPKLRRFASHFDALTLPDYLASRFVSKRPLLRVAAAVVIIFSSILYLVAIFKGAGNLFQQFLQVRYEVAVGIVLVVVMLYTSVGGFISVVRTDVLQGILMVIGSVTIFYFVTDAAGGITVLSELKNRPGSSHLFDWNAAIPLVVLLGIALSGSLKLLVDPRQVSRFYALKDDRSVKVGLWVSLIGIALIMFCLFPIGLYAHFLLDGVTETDMIVPTLVNDRSVFPLWVGDFLIIAMLAAAMSSMDSVLLVAASVLYKDLVEVVSPVARPLAWTRGGVVGLAALSALAALRPPGDIIEITIFSGSLYAVCFFPALVFGLHWRQGSANAVLASMALGIGVLIGWLVLGLGAYVHEVFPALFVSCATYVLVTRVTTDAIQRWPDVLTPD